MERMFTAIRRYFQDLGLFGTGVGLAVPELPEGERIRPVARAA